jgi:photosystem II stability/assembly factor-like uncharacterized protein
MKRILVFLLVAGAAAAAHFEGLQWRMIGPFRAGRTLAVSGVPGDGNSFFLGSVGGGVWKSTNVGMTWSPVFDEQKIGSIGAIAVAPSSPNVVYVGTGEADMRSDISFGDGMYKSVDGGKSWKHIGLDGTRQIGRIAVDPANADVVFVAALGHPYGPNEERGVYKSTDGGATWRKVLDKGQDVGAIDISMDPENERVMYAAMWNARRPTWSQYPPISGPGGGLYKSVDGGEKWTQVSGNGLPGGEWGRVGVAAAKGNRVYALVDTGKTGLYRSDDAGAHWTVASTDQRIDSRAWYFSGVTVDPNNPDIVYLPNVGLYRSTDGGKNFTVIKGAPGGDDYHSLWVDAKDSRRMILGTDQGATVSVDGGATWSSWYNQPTAQFYHVATDDQFPYIVYGCQQDSGTVAIASRTNHNQIQERDWFSVGGAESGYIAPDPKDPNIVYVNDTGGQLTRFDKRTAQSQNITPWPMRGGGGPQADIATKKYRNTWTSPLVFSPVDKTSLYFGTQYVMKTLDGGLTWKEISPDLTGKDGRGVVYTIGPSAIETALVWAGSDTGLVHVTRNGGETWSNVTPPAVSEWSKITFVEASHFEAATAYMAVDGHRKEDYKPHLFRTKDYGKTWTDVSAGIPEPSFVNVIREDPARKGLLFAGTELGVYVSFNDGDAWEPLQMNLPYTSVRDIVIHGDDLVIATHGRGFWIMDDISSLRQTATGDVFLYKPATAIRMMNDDFLGTPLPPEEPTARNPPMGAVVDYYLKSEAREVTLEVLKGSDVVRKISSAEQAPLTGRQGLGIADYWLIPPPKLPVSAGMNRFVWDLRYSPKGPMILPGSYTLRLTVAGKSYSQPLVVKMDPRSAATADDLAKQLDLGLKISKAMGRAKSSREASAALASAMAVVTSADRTPPAVAYQIYEDAVSKLK